MFELSINNPGRRTKDHSKNLLLDLLKIIKPNHLRLVSLLPPSPQNVIRCALCTYRTSGSRPIAEVVIERIKITFRFIGFYFVDLESADLCGITLQSISIFRLFTTGMHHEKNECGIWV